MRTKIYGFFSQPAMSLVWPIVLISTLLTYFTGGLGYIFGLLIGIDRFLGG